MMIDPRCTTCKWKHVAAEYDQPFQRCRGTVKSVRRSEGQAWCKGLEKR